MRQPQRLQTVGNAPAEQRQRASSAQNAVQRNLQQMAGNALAEQQQRANSAQSAAHRSLRRQTAGPALAVQ